MSENRLRDFSIVELKLAIKRIIRCYMNDLDRRPTLKEIDSVYYSVIIEFLEEKHNGFRKKKTMEFLSISLRALKQFNQSL